MNAEQAEIFKQLGEQAARMLEGVAAPETVHITVRAIDLQKLLSFVPAPVAAAE